eukprot:TRINITY_DN12022_c1_g1_i1.p2 TRINITY_DN12022_c1_g1~~TRINITY_DN12022_c1_g1_i1.p2  ORF type:complete len:166 (+),score=9.58 TRINITY_DN12022_c1_g1_i1:450-947(+)
MPSTTEIIKHPLADPWTQEELPYLLTLPVYITLIGVLLLLLVIIARCVCCGCCVPSRDHWWFTEPFLGSINADVYVDTAQHLGRQPRGVISTVIHTVSIVLLWSLVANIFDWTSYRDATPVFLMTAGGAIQRYLSAKRALEARCAFDKSCWTFQTLSPVAALSSC